jgi:type II secretory pathway pseudopilin PulG
VRRSSTDDAAERGLTLVELLITVWIMGAVMVTLIGALFTMTKASDFQRRLAAVDVELRHYAEALRSATYLPCAGQTDAASNTLPTYSYTPTAN